MTLSANCVWEIRPSTGSDNNGGGFVAGATGTDYSQQAAAQVAYTDLVIDGTTNTKVTSAGKPFGAAHVGNILNVTGGTGFTTGRYQVVSVAAAVATLDRAVGTVSSTGGTGNLGGAAATIPSVMGSVSASGSAGNKFFVKAESTIVTTASIALNAPASNPPTTTSMPNRLIGYTTTRGDGGRATVQLSTNTGLIGLNATTNGWRVENFTVDCNTLGTSTGIQVTHYSTIRNCAARNFTSAGLTSTSAATTPSVQDCEATGGTAAASGAINLPASSASVLRCFVHDNACPGIVGGNNSDTIVSNLVTNNTGASSDGIRVQNESIVLSNTCYGNGRDGIRLVATGWISQCIRNNLLAKNGGYGLTLGNASVGIPADPDHDGNAYWSNTSGTRNAADDTTSNAVNAVAPYVNVLDVILTADPFVNAAAGDFRLNPATLCRGTGFPGTLPGDPVGVGYLDMGCYQHRDPVRLRGRLGAGVF